MYAGPAPFQATSLITQIQRKPLCPIQPGNDPTSSARTATNSPGRRANATPTSSNPAMSVKTADSVRRRRRAIVRRYRERRAEDKRNGGVRAFSLKLRQVRERVCSSNPPRSEGENFLARAPRVPVRTEVETFPLTEANETLTRLRTGRLRGAAVLAMD